MALKEIIEKDRLRIIRDGTIYTNLGNIRGVNPVEACPFGRTDIKATLVKYVSSDEIPPQGKSNSEFVFYGELSEDIEGKEFAFTETYPGKDKTQVPLEQFLAVFGEGFNFETFEFPEK